MKPSRCVLESLEGVWRATKQAQASFGEGSGWFLRGFYRRIGKLVKNIDFAEGTFIFSRVLRFKIDPKSTKIRSWRLKFDFGGSKLAKMSILEAKNTILEAKMAILDAKKPFLEAKMAKII